MIEPRGPRKLSSPTLRHRGTRRAVYSIQAPRRGGVLGRSRRPPRRMFGLCRDRDPDRVKGRRLMTQLIASFSHNVPAVLSGWSRLGER